MLFALKTTANREEQVLDFVSSHAKKKNLRVYSIIHPHGMKGYVIVEAESKADVEEASRGVPYARSVLSSQIKYEEIAGSLEQIKTTVHIRKGDIVEIISGPFKREKARVARVDQQKEDVVVELLEAAVPIPITVKLDSVRVIRMGGESDEESSGGEEEKTNFSWGSGGS
ncbi:MAG: transcription elongation factor Spt5 [Nanoarchaeota archaeon]|nr:transcription elongation factor Spt5 [Nanoarchaeota archaeon]